MDTGRVVWLVCIVLFTGIGAVWDLRTRKLPNVLTVPAFGAGLLFHAVNGLRLFGMSGIWSTPKGGVNVLGGLPGAGLLFALQGFAVGFAILFTLWLIGGMSGGDVKFMAALGCWMGGWLIVQVFVLSALLAGSIEGLNKVNKSLQRKRMEREKHNLRARRERKKKEADGWSRPLRAGGGWHVAYGVSVAAVTWVLLALQQVAHWTLPSP